MEALQILFSAIIIGIMLIFFYVWLAKASNLEKQQTVVESTAVRFDVDQLIAQWAAEAPEDFLAAAQATPRENPRPYGLPDENLALLKDSFRERLSEQFIIDEIYEDPGVTCTRTDILRCEFDIKQSSGANKILDYQQSFFLPWQNDLLEIRFVGEIGYE